MLKPRHTKEINRERRTNMQGLLRETHGFYRTFGRRTIRFRNKQEQCERLRGPGRGRLERVREPGRGSNAIQRLTTLNSNDSADSRNSLIARFAAGFES